MWNLHNGSKQKIMISLGADGFNQSKNWMHQKSIRTAHNANSTPIDDFRRKLLHVTQNSSIKIVDV